ncbi:MAG: hypothetical protein ACYDH6_05975 [Acidimicrobiales bacterium]
MRVGIMLPTFTTDLAAALDVARVAESGDLDGVFAFDHLWPMGSPGRPALWSFSVLGAIAAVTERVAMGPLVARIDLLPEDELVRAFTTLAAIVGRTRVIATLGAGDNLSAQENLAYGLAREPVAARLAMIGRVADRLRGEHIETWIGGGSPRVAALADAHADAHNVWGVDGGVITTLREGDGHVPLTWAGQVLIGRDEDEVAALRARFGMRDGLVSGTVAQVASHLGALGTPWCVCAPLDYIEQPVRAAETVCLVAEAVH